MSTPPRSSIFSRRSWAAWRSPVAPSRCASSTASAAHASAPTIGSRGSAGSGAPSTARRRSHASTHRVKRSTLACSSVVGGLRPGGERVARLLVLPAGDVRARERRQEQAGGPVVAREPLQEQRAVRVLLGVVVLAARDRELRERGERQPELQRVLRAVGDVASTRARASRPRRSARATRARAAPGTPDRPRAASRRARRARARRRPPTWPATRAGRSAPTAARSARWWRARRPSGRRCSAAIAIARSAHCVACFMRHSTQYDCDSSTSASAASSGVVGLDLVDQRLERTAVGDHVEHLVGADAAADAPEVQLGAGVGVGVGPEQLERGARSGRPPAPAAGCPAGSGPPAGAARPARPAAAGG